MTGKAAQFTHLGYAAFESVGYEKKWFAWFLLSCPTCGYWSRLSSAS